MTTIGSGTLAERVPLPWMRVSVCVSVKSIGEYTLGVPFQRPLIGPVGPTESWQAVIASAVRRSAPRRRGFMPKFMAHKPRIASRALAMRTPHRPLEAKPPAGRSPPGLAHKPRRRHAATMDADDAGGTWARRYR